MAITTIGGTINSTAVSPNLDYKYGPYSSLQDAYDALGPEGIDKLTIGLTVGIIEDGVITEYWFKDGTGLENLVQKSWDEFRFFSFEIYSSTQDITTPKSSVLYLIGPATISGSDKYEEYVYSNNQFIKIGDTSIDLSGYVTTSDLNDALKIPIYSNIPAGGMLSNVVYNLGTLDSDTTFTLSTPTDNTILNHWSWTFDIENTVPTLTWPVGLIWAGANVEPIISSNTHYEISVLNNVGTYIDSPIIPLL